MGSRATRAPAGVEGVLGVLLAGRPTRSLEEIVRASGRTAGSALVALVWLRSWGWVAASPSGYALTEHGIRQAQVFPSHVLPASRVRAELTGGQPRALGAGPRAVLDLAVARFGFRDASRYRDELRLLVAGYSAAGQWAQATSTLMLRWMLWRRRSCHFGRHSFVVRHDNSTSVGATYFECATCGAFSSTLFGEAYPLLPKAPASS